MEFRYQSLKNKFEGSIDQQEGKKEKRKNDWCGIWWFGFAPVILDGGYADVYFWLLIWMIPFSIFSGMWP